METIVILRSITSGDIYREDLAERYNGSPATTRYYHVVEADSDYVRGWYKKQNGNICGFNRMTGSFLQRTIKVKPNELDVTKEDV